MKFTSPLFIISASVLIGTFSCSPKRAKTTAATQEVEKSSSAQAKPADAPIPSATFDPSANDPSPDLPIDKQLEAYKNYSDQKVAMGNELWETKCSSCHDLHKPESRTADKWIGIMKVMGKKAKLNQLEYGMISAYLVQHAKQ